MCLVELVSILVSVLWHRYLSIVYNASSGAWNPPYVLKVSHVLEPVSETSSTFSNTLVVPFFDVCSDCRLVVFRYVGKSVHHPYAEVHHERPACQASICTFHDYRFYLYVLKWHSCAISYVVVRIHPVEDVDSYDRDEQLLEKQPDRVKSAGCGCFAPRTCHSLQGAGSVW